MKIIFLGEILIDLISKENLKDTVSFTKKMGGSPLNIAINLSQLGIRSSIISRIGNDPFGKFIMENLKKYNINTDHIQVDEFHNTTVVFVSKSKGTPDFFIIRGADKFYEIPKINFDNAKFLHLSCWTITHEENFTKTIKLIEQAKNCGVKIGFDPNCRQKIFCSHKIDLDKIFEILKNTFIIKPSLDDAREIFGPLPKESYIELLHKFGIKYVILTLGKDGALVSDGTKIEHIPSKATKVIDSTGAGDAFWAGIYFGLLNNWPIFKAAKFGSILSSIVLKNVGAISNLTEAKNYIKELENENN
ncbi:carbohydrate kinase family protein [Thermosipho atlanticus]|uniref:Fructokinase n=1 Tax=Thermosipho atlanticus DSM 15807 TaxID=1123380 RepID=A0A1M5QN38_9BACT|nr:carbohydrate kinase [Thermosipho atlanticus]SHH15472.1 fructokinase [Thermosipho atlanticus DSM 15807]